MGNLGSVPWAPVLAFYCKLRKQGIEVDLVLVKKVGNGRSTSFWKERWNGDLISI